MVGKLFHSIFLLPFFRQFDSDIDVGRDLFPDDEGVFPSWSLECIGIGSMRVPTLLRDRDRLLDLLSKDARLLVYLYHLHINHAFGHVYRPFYERLHKIRICLGICNRFISNYRNMEFNWRYNNVCPMLV